MAILIALTLIFAVLLESSYSEASGYSRGYGSSRRGVRPTSEDRRLSELEARVNAIRKDVDELQDATGSPPAAFTAFYRFGVSEVPAGVDPFPFPFAVVYGDVYNTDTGVFTAPFNGIYNFGISIRPFNIDPASDFASVDIIRRTPGGPSFPISQLTSSNEELPFDVSSLSLVIYLEAGCEVFLINNVTASFSAGTAFSGFLIDQITLDQDAREVMERN